MEKVSVIVSTYNRPDALELSLKSLMRQTRLPDEIVVGDDGSGPETREVVERMQSISPVPIIHVWHPDEGFRLAAIRNKAVLASTGDYIIQIDGDIIAHRHFVEDHVSHARPGCYMRGGRVMLSREFTEQLCASREPATPGFFSGGIENKRGTTLRITPLASMLALRYKPKSYALGCNMSFWRSDFFDINGYDEEFVGWGGEESDFSHRLLMKGVKYRRLKFAGIVYHLWHKTNSMDNLEKNTRYCEREDKSIVCANGVSKHIQL